MKLNIREKTQISVFDIQLYAFEHKDGHAYIHILRCLSGYKMKDKYGDVKNTTEEIWITSYRLEDQYNELPIPVLERLAKEDKITVLYNEENQRVTPYFIMDFHHAIAKTLY